MFSPSSASGPKSPLAGAPQASSPVIVTWGELLWDVFPDGRKLGGAPANVAYHVNTLGGAARLISRVGADDLGAEALDHLAHVGITTRWVQRDETLPTGSVSIELSDAEPRYSFPDKVAWDNLQWCDELEALLAHAGVFYFGTLAQRQQASAAGLERVLAALPKACRRLCDLNLREPFVTRPAVELALERAAAVKLNLDECATLARLFALHVAAADDVSDVVAAWLRARFAIDLLVVTRGAQGSVMWSGTERAEHPGNPLLGNDGDAVGAGDAFAAVLALALTANSGVISQRELGVISERANRYACYVASQRGAMPSCDQATLERVLAPAPAASDP